MGLRLKFNLVLLAVFAGVGFISGLRVNLTPSYPLGLWRIEPLAHDPGVGDRIFICPPPDPAFELARDRGYLGHGLCPGWFSPLIKTVVAVAGQRVVVDGDIAVGGVHLPHSSVRPTDGAGRALAPFAGGIVPNGQTQWLVVYDVDDPLGFATRELYGDRPEVRQVQVDAGDTPIKAHTAYWKSGLVIREAAQLIATRAGAAY